MSLSQPNVPRTRVEDDEDENLLGKYLSCTTCCIFVTIFVNFFAFMTIFGMANPDQEAWVGTLESGQWSMFPTESDG